MVYTISGIRFPAIPSAYGLSSSSSFNGDLRSTSLSLLLKKNSVSRKIFARKPYDSDSSSLAVSSSDKVLVPGSESEAPGSVSEEPQVLDVEDLTMEDDEAVEDTVSAPSQVAVADSDDKALLEETSDPLEVVASATTVETAEIKRKIPPPGAGQRIYKIDPSLNGHRQHLDYRRWKDEYKPNLRISTTQNRYPKNLGSYSVQINLPHHINLFGFY